MNNEASFALLIAQSLVDSTKTSQIGDFIGCQRINWETFLSTIHYHELLPITYILLEDKARLIPPAIYAELKNGYFHNLANNILLWEHFLAISRVLSERKIGFIPMKGFSFIGDIYPDINYRSMADIDILVKEESLKLVEETLLNMGYDKYLEGLKEAYWRKEQCHIAFLKHLSPARNILVEVHWDLDFKRLKHPVLPEVWERVDERDIEGNRIRSLSCEDAIFSLALHKRRFGNILSLKGACDLACLIKKFRPKIDWQYLLKWSRISKMKSTLYFSLSQASLIDDTLIPASFLDELAVPFWKRRAINNLISKNTFSNNGNMKNVYRRAHFLLYDSLREPVNYIINIPQEQFAKFYGLNPYTEKTCLLHKMRLLYLPLRSLIYPMESRLNKYK